MPSLIGPESVALSSAVGVGAFFYLRPVEIVHGTERFIFMVDTHTSTWRIRVFLRNNGTGIWNEQNVGAGPTVVNTLAGNDIFGCPSYIKDPLNPDIALMAYPRSADSTIAITAFNMSTKLFGATITGGPLVSKVDVVFAGPPSSVYSDDTGGKTCFAYRPSDDKFVFAYQGPVEVVAGANCLRPYYVTVTRLGVWSAATQLGFAGVYNPFQPVGIVNDPHTSISYVAIVKPNGGTGATTQEIWYAQIDADDTIHTPVLVTNDVKRDREPYISYPALQFKLGFTIFQVVYVDDGTAGFFKVRAARCQVGPAPAFTIEDVSTTALTAPGGDNFVSPSIAIGLDNNPVVVWLNAVAPDFAYRMWYSQGGLIGDPWIAPINPWTVVDIINDFMERPVTSFLPGI